MAVVVFDIADFRTIYPQFAELTDAQLTAFFEDACLYLDNTDASPVQNITLRKSLLYKIVCHLATLAQRGVVRVDGLFVAEMTAVQKAEETPGWQLLRDRVYGKTRICIWRRTYDSYLRA